MARRTIRGESRSRQLTFGSRFSPRVAGSNRGTTARAGGPLRVAGFFAGIGGLERGLAESGHHAVTLCEFDTGAQAVLRERFPGVKLLGDVRGVEALPDCDLVAAGFPCQDLSQAGRTAGIGGKRSGLVQEVFRLIGLAKSPPEWILLENVPFMLQLERGRAMTYLVEQLETLGYRWAYRVIDAHSLGLPQRRRRVVVLAARTADPRDVLLVDSDGEDRALSSEGARFCGFYWTEGVRGLGWAIEAVPTLKGGSTIGIPSPPAIWDMSSGLIGTPSLRDSERLQGFPAGWTEPTSRVPGFRDSFRWKLVGNAVNVRMSEWLGRRLLQPGTYDDSADFPLSRDETWPDAAWGGSGVAHRADVTEWVKSRRKQLRLSEFLLDELKPLSIRASSGFLERTTQGSLRFPKGFLDAVRAHALRIEEDAAARGATR